MIDKNFENVFKQLRALYKKQSDILSQLEVSDINLTNLKDDTLNISSFESIESFFNSDEIDRAINSSTNYGKDSEFNNVKSRHVMKAQSDLLDVLERDMKLSSKNRIRATAHEAARRLSASEKTGPVKSHILAFIDNLNRANY